MTLKILPDATYVRECLDYDPTAGEFRWRSRPLAHFPNLRTCNACNTRRACKLAGTINSNGYRVIRIDQHNYAAHRLAFLLMHGQPVPEELDHHDGDRLNNRIGNLRAITRSANLANARKRKDNTSGIKGVIRFVDGRFRANVTYKGKNHYLGIFHTIEEATTARKEAADRIYGRFARHG